MIKSDSIKELSEALSKAQAEIQNAKKDADNPFFNSRYSTLASVWNACREPITKHGLAVTQMVSVKDGYAVVETVLTHSSGQFISSEISALPGYTDKHGNWVLERDVQSFGSTFTYLRRYALAAVAGVASEDGTDGTPHKKAFNKSFRQPAVSSLPPANNNPLQPGRDLAAEADDIIISKEMLVRLNELVKTKKVPVEAVKAIVKSYGFSQFKAITRKCFDDIYSKVASVSIEAPEAQPSEPEIAYDQEPTSWQEVKVPVLSADYLKKFPLLEGTSGKKLSEITEPQVELLFSSFKPMVDLTTGKTELSSLYMVNALKQWFGEKR